MKYYRVTMTMDYEAKDEDDAARQASNECDYTMRIMAINEMSEWPWRGERGPEPLLDVDRGGSSE